MNAEELFCEIMRNPVITDAYMFHQVRCFCANIDKMEDNQTKQDFIKMLRQFNNLLKVAK